MSGMGGIYQEQKNGARRGYVRVWSAMWLVERHAAELRLQEAAKLFVVVIQTKIASDFNILWGENAFANCMSLKVLDLTTQGEEEGG